MRQTWRIGKASAELAGGTTEAKWRSTSRFGMESKELIKVGFA